MGEQNPPVFGVVGLGEVGLPLALRVAESGYDVVGVDIDEERIRSLKSGESYIIDIPSSDVQATVDDGVTVTTEYERLSDATHIALCVPTPLQKSGQPDISYIVAAVDELVEVISPETTVIIESTVYPGATENLIREIVTDAGFTVGEDIYLASSPERIDPGNEQYDLEDIPKVVGGVTASCQAQTERLYEDIFQTVVSVNSATEAEMTKILENTFRNVNIALVNELVKVADNFGIDFWNVIEAAKTKPYGFMPFYPGPGLGGHCIPVDPIYLSWRARQNGIDTPLVDLADRTNREMPEYIVRRLTEVLNERGIALSESRILILGVAYKSGVPDTRKSPAIDIIDGLEKSQASITYHDPYVPRLNVNDVGPYTSVELTDDLLASVDCTLIVTNHPEIEIETIVDRSSLIFDTRNATANYDADNIYRL
ncbi:nucleotide sugar dehydrogenase [Halomicrobium sp. IBSBa]|uniref:nucleotide sugar dehydrogenase n=1 Tax=Halomicrobium sp. IBSBa TaxID=2778916 RepID=UPI001ABF8D88|nr:nucleotide sugar dehydrogenase [Halomicrobium sp. IBSBa]MBO4249545.1 nucleotide sugar dehydrogenase [Halomicrobium sp. IBSBa]